MPATLSSKQAAEQRYLLHSAALLGRSEDSLLELACGSGLHLAKLHQAFALKRADGIDLQDSPHFPQDEALRFFQGDLSDLKNLTAKLASYSKLLCVDASYHFLTPEFPVAKLLESQGIFCVSCLICHPPSCGFLKKVSFKMWLFSLKLVRIRPLCEASTLKNPYFFKALRLETERSHKASPAWIQ